jgi:predicted naringenin-chalcone synthase
MSLDLAIPTTLSAEAPSFLGELLAAGRVRSGDVRHWAFHPGGRRIVEAVAEGLELATASAAPSLSVLRDFGNMSSGTVFFILERISNGGLHGATVAMGFGPGLTTEGAVLVPVDGS